MIGLLQRAHCAQVEVAGETIAAIDQGLLVMIGVTRDDVERDAERLAERLLGYRVFSDEAGRMNRSLADAGGGLLLVPQFTLAARTRKGTRASFTTAAPPDRAEALFAHLVACVRTAHEPVVTGRFGADMQVHLVNDGPVTFRLES